MKRRAFTLLEALLCLALLGLVLGLAGTQLRKPQRSQQSRALAELLVARLNQTRQRAMATGRCVALAFPRRPGESSSQSAYWLEGEPGQVPLRTAVFPWARDLPQAVCFSGVWRLVEPAQWREDAEPPRFLPNPADAVIQFTAAGQVHSNLPMHSGAFWLVSCTGFSGAAELQAIAHPWSVRIARTGLVELIADLPQAAHVHRSDSLGVPGSLRDVPPAAGENSPTLESVSAEPPPVTGSLPSGVDASVRPDGYLTFRVEASDADQEPLRCFWESSLGRFSSAQEAEMEWDPQLRRWVAHWTFTPPPDAREGDVYTLVCRVRDPKGHEVSGTFPVGGRVLITRKQQLCFASDIDTNQPARRGLYISNVDGLERRLLFDARGTLDCPRWSPDGSRILFLYDPNAGINLDLWIVRADGSGLKKLIDAGDQGWVLVAGASFTADGTKIVVDGYRSTNHDLVWIDVDGNRPSNPAQVGYDVIRASIPGETSFTGMDIHPTSGHILLTDRNGQFHLYRTDGSEIPVSQPPLPGGILERQSCFSPDGTSLYFNDSYRTIYAAPFTLSGPAASVGAPVHVVGSAAAPVQGPHVSPDGSCLFYNRDIGGQRLQVIKRDLATGTEFLLTPPGVCDDDVWCSP